MNLPSLRWAQQDIREFHEACDLVVKDAPAPRPDPALISLRVALLREESKEAIAALEECCFTDSLAPLAHVAKELADVIVVALGAAVSLGINMEPVWNAVHASNMAKRDPATGKVLRREDGKVLKPPGWTPPNIEEIIRRQS